MGISSPVFGCGLAAGSCCAGRSCKTDSLTARRPPGPRAAPRRHVHELARFALVEPELIEQRFRNFSLGQCHVSLSRIVALTPAQVCDDLRHDGICIVVGKGAGNILKLSLSPHFSTVVIPSPW